MKKLSTLALVCPLALGLGAAAQEASAAPASSGAFDVLMSSESLRGDVTNETMKDGLVQPAYYYGRRYYRPYRYGYYGRPYYRGYGYYGRTYNYRYYRPYRYGYY